MRLTQIKLAGFKSFVDPTVIPTPSQLVGVVGPNGCGKSNIIDAVRWVLGETRASELRGESMQDVIFNGSGLRKPSGRASVELVFDNTEGRGAGQWGSYTDIAVRRVLTRDGTSSYFVNNQQVRRRDIHDIFMGTGLGTRGYAIIGQGMINRLIEARPEELRVYLEEAAGVSRYKERRRETENRLADTRENLIRLDDILRELHSQLERLEAQAEVAQRYRSLQEDGQLKQQVLWLLKEAQAQHDQKNQFAATEQAQNELESALAILRATEASLESQRQAHYDAGDAVHTAQGQLFEAGAQVSRLEAEIRHVVDNRNRVQNRQQQLQQQRQEWAEQQEHFLQAIADASQQLEQASANSEIERMRAQEAENRLPELESAVRQDIAQREGLRDTLSQLQQELALVAQAQRDADRQLQGLNVRRERLDRELRDVPLPDTASLQGLADDIKAMSQQLAQAQNRLLKLEQQQPVLDQQRRQAQGHAQDATQKLATLDANLQALKKIQADVQTQGALQAWLEKHELHSLGRLWKQLGIQAGWETALEAVLRERMAGIEVSKLEQIQALISDVPPARLMFYQLSDSQPTLQTTQGLTPLSDLLRLADPGLHALVAYWLDLVYICTDVAQALATRHLLPAGAMYVVAQGHLVDAHSVRFYAPDSEQAGLLARQQEIARLQSDQGSAQAFADQAVAAMTAAEVAARQADTDLSLIRTQVVDLTRNLHQLQLEHANKQQQAAQAQQQAHRLQQDIAEIAYSIETLTAAKEEAEIRFETLDEQLGEHQETYSQAELLGEALHRQAQDIRQQIRQTERIVQESEYSERTLQARIAELQRNLEQAQSQGIRAATELDSLQGELFDLDASAAQAGLEQALEVRAQHEEALNQARIAQDNLAALLRSADEQRLIQERALDPLRDRITELQLQEQAARLAVEQFSQQLEAKQVDRQALWDRLDTLSPEWQRTAWLQAEVQRISRQVDSLGAVNLAALDELSAAQERQGFLDAQCTDLNTAINTLEDAIRKIDKETRHLLQTTFDAVNQYFGELFPLLFGGGEAKLTMSGEEILDAGVLVMAQPPGKRNSTIHLLSGGEKALTATALVFALFKLNPAPFCLLDEVDAPLDDANTERYANLVKKMSQHTQFLFISHNKIAMQMAKQLVGVTMQEQGVSRIVAVDIDAALQLAEV